jgi:hypothetical protein
METTSSNAEVDHYMKQLNEIEKKAYLIAQEHLGTSFNILKSNGYIEWSKKNNNHNPSKSTT